MKLVTALLIALILSAVAFSQDSGSAAKVVDIFGDALTKSNLDKIDELFSDNTTVYWVDKKLYGKPTVLKFLRKQITASEKHGLSFSPDDGLENETISTTWGTFAINYGSLDGQVSNQILGRYTAIAKKTGEGKWQIVSMHLSTTRFSD